MKKEINNQTLAAKSKKTKVVAGDKGKKQSGRNLKANVLNIEGKVIGFTELPKSIFGAKINKALMAQAVRVYLANQRLGSAYAKSRGQISYSTKKVWRQKGTGRARHGARSAPIFVKGGVAHGPTPRDYSLRLSKKMKKASLFSALSSKLSDGSIKIVSGLEDIEPKTKKISTMLAKLDLDKNKVLFIVDEKAGNVKRAGRNIDTLNILGAKTLNTYEILKNKQILIMKEALGKIEETFLGEIK